MIHVKFIANKALPRLDLVGIFSLLKNNEALIL